MIEREVDGLPADKSTALLKSAKRPITTTAGPDHLPSLRVPEEPLFFVEPRSPGNIVNFATFGLIANSSIFWSGEK